MRKELKQLRYLMMEHDVANSAPTASETHVSSTTANVGDGNGDDQLVFGLRGGSSVSSSGFLEVGTGSRSGDDYIDADEEGSDSDWDGENSWESPPVLLVTRVDTTSSDVRGAFEPQTSTQAQLASARGGFGRRLFQRRRQAQQQTQSLPQQPKGAPATLATTSEQPMSHRLRGTTNPHCMMACSSPSAQYFCPACWKDGRFSRSKRGARSCAQTLAKIIEEGISMRALRANVKARLLKHQQSAGKDMMQMSVMTPDAAPQRLSSDPPQTTHVADLIQRMRNEMFDEASIKVERLLQARNTNKDLTNSTRWTSLITKCTTSPESRLLGEIHRKRARIARLRQAVQVKRMTCAAELNQWSLLQAMADKRRAVVRALENSGVQYKAIAEDLPDYHGFQRLHLQPPTLLQPSPLPEIPSDEVTKPGDKVSWSKRARSMLDAAQKVGSDTSHGGLIALADVLDQGDGMKEKSQTLFASCVEMVASNGGLQRVVSRDAWKLATTYIRRLQYQRLRAVQQWFLPSQQKVLEIPFDASGRIGPVLSDDPERGVLLLRVYAALLIAVAGSTGQLHTLQWDHIYVQLGNLDKIQTPKLVPVRFKPRKLSQFDTFHSFLTVEMIRLLTTIGVDPTLFETTASDEEVALINQSTQQAQTELAELQRQMSRGSTTLGSTEEGDPLESAPTTSPSFDDSQTGVSRAALQAFDTIRSVANTTSTAASNMAAAWSLSLASIISYKIETRLSPASAFYIGMQSLRSLSKGPKSEQPMPSHL
eukprot:m.192415 g.192415  ORF g.192415 m.192415 type:complete len:765 (-) comp14854_c1_seq1:172-2466(-)